MRPGERNRTTAPPAVGTWGNVSHNSSGHNGHLKFKGVMITDLAYSSKYVSTDLTTKYSRTRKTLFFSSTFFNMVGCSFFIWGKNQKPQKALVFVTKVDSLTVDIFNQTYDV